MSALISACVSGDIDNGKTINSEYVLYHQNEFTYNADVVSLPKNIGAINNIAYHNDKLFFSTKTENKNPDESIQTGISLYICNLDGTGVKKLENYAHPIINPDNTYTDFDIAYMRIDNEGGIWVCEVWIVDNGFSLGSGTDDIANANNPPAYAGASVRKLDTTGREICAADLADMQNNGTSLIIHSFGIDDANNIYVRNYNRERDINAIFVFNQGGEHIFSLETEQEFDDFVALPDGTMAFSGKAEGKDGAAYRILLTIDTRHKRLGEMIVTPFSEGNYYAGYDGIIFDDYKSLYDLSINENKFGKLLDWVEIGVTNNDLKVIGMSDDGKIICINYTWDNAAGMRTREVIVLTKIPRSGTKEKTTLKLATLSDESNTSTYWINEMAAKFNNENPDYRIEIIDYSQFGTRENRSNGIMKLNNDIISGNAPDILDLSYLPYSEYASRGLFADLYPFIDSDGQINRDDLNKNVFAAAEIDGKLFQVFNEFRVWGMVCHQSDVNENISWTIDEFIAFLDEHHEADVPLGPYTNMQILQMLVSANIDEYIDWGTGGVYFDTDDFIKLLGLANRFPDEIVKGYGYRENKTIPENRQVARLTNNINYFQYGLDKPLFSNGLMLKGLPAGNGNGVNIQVDFGLAILDNSSNKEAAWAFIDSASGMAGICTDDAVMNIIIDCAAMYFNELCSAGEAAGDIQKRISILVSERS